MSFLFDSGATRDHDRFCAECDYNLRGLPHGAPCPECGEPTVREQEDVAPVLPEHVYQGRVLVDQAEAFAEPEPSRGSTRRPQCSGCGYDITGLAPVGRCPECGRPYGGERHRPVQSRPQLVPDDVVLSTSWRTGALLAFASVVAYASCSLFSLYWGGLSSTAYAGIMVVITGGWAFGVWLLFPRSLQTAQVWQDWLRCGARLSQFAWPLSMISTWAGVVDVLPSGLTLLVSTGLDLVAFAGFILIMVALGIMMNDMGLRFASKRLIAGMWILLPAGVLALVLPVPTIAEPGFTSAAGKHVVIMMLILLLPHYTIVVIMILTLFDLVGYGRWSVRYDRFLAERPDRIAAKQAAMDGGAEWGATPDPEEPEAMESPEPPVVSHDDVEDEHGDIPLA